MPVGSTTQYGLSSNIALKQAFEPGFVDAVYRNSFIGSVHPRTLQPLFPIVQMVGDTSYRWKLASAANSSTELFAEGSAQSAHSSQTYINMAVAVNFFRTNIRITGHTRSAMGSQWFSIFENEFALGQRDIIDLVSTTTLSAASSGLEVAIDSTTNYGGQTRSSVACIQSFEHALSSTLTVSELIDVIEGVKDQWGGMAVNTSFLLGPWNQISNYSRLIGVPAASSAGPRYNVENGGGKMDYAPNYDSGCSCAGIPIIAANDATDPVIMLMDTVASQLKCAVLRPFELREDTSGDDDLYQLSTAMVAIVGNPIATGKTTAVTA